MNNKYRLCRLAKGKFSGWLNTEIVVGNFTKSPTLNESFIFFHNAGVRATSHIDSITIENDITTFTTRTGSTYRLEPDATC